MRKEKKMTHPFLNAYTKHNFTKRKNKQENYMNLNRKKSNLANAHLSLQLMSVNSEIADPQASIALDKLRDLIKQLAD